MCTDSITSTASESYLKGIQWLENAIRFDEQKLQLRLRESEEELREISEEKLRRGIGADTTDLVHKEVDASFRINDLKARLKLKYRCEDAEAIWVLKKTNSALVDEFISSAREPAFWEDESEYFQILDDSHTLWFLKEAGVGNSPGFLESVDNLTKNQSVEGYIQSNEFDHSGPLRVLVATMPESEALSSALSYWLENWKELGITHGTLAVGILALTELDCEKYLNAIREETNYLKSFQNEDGSWGLVLGGPYSKEGRISETSYAIWAISRVDDITDSVGKGVKWLVERQEENGSWENNSNYTAQALLGLLAAGQGQKMPLETTNFQLIRLEQRLRRQKPVFIHTSPLYQNSIHVKGIYERVSKMLHNAQSEIRIASPFIDMFYEEIINLKQQNPNLIVKIITRPKQEAEGLRERIARNVIDLLDIATKGNVVQSTLIHSRMIIIDDEEVLVSSADLTRDQLFDEFNAGLWTSDKETVKEAIDFFENLFELERAHSRT